MQDLKENEIMDVSGGKLCECLIEIRGGEMFILGDYGPLSTKYKCTLQCCDLRYRKVFRWGGNFFKCIKLPPLPKFVVEWKDSDFIRMDQPYLDDQDGSYFY